MTCGTDKTYSHDATEILLALSLSKPHFIGLYIPQGNQNNNTYKCDYNAIIM